MRVIMTFLNLNQHYLESKWCVFIDFFIKFCISNFLSLFLINQVCFKSLSAMIMCIIIGDKKAQVLGMKCYSRKIAETTKNLVVDELKQFWNREDVVAIPAAIQEQLQKRLHTC